MDDDNIQFCVDNMNFDLQYSSGISLWKSHSTPLQILPTHQFLTIIKCGDYPPYK